METVKGYVEHIIFQNNENGYTVMNLMTEGSEIICVGMGKGLTQGENIAVQGEYVDHPVYGTQLKMASFQVVVPKDSIGMERYLGSGAIKGVGPALAARIVRQFGDDTFRIIEEEPERLAEIRGVSERKARDIAVQMEEKRDLRDALVFLQQYGISNALAVKIYETYGANLYGVMKENPYRLAEDIHGIGFRLADELAEKIGIHTDSDYRIRSGIFYTLLQTVGEGHCYFPMESLLERAGKLLGVAKEHIRPQLDNLMMDKKLVIKGDNVFSSSYYYAELNCARMLEELNIWMRPGDSESPAESGTEPPGRENGGTGLDPEVAEHLKKLAKSLHMELDELQLRAVTEAIHNGLFILSGGPGTGKTTTINMMIRYFEAEGLDIFLAAPTGRAAKRMTEATGFEARTIHRMLELNSALSDEDTKKVRFERNEENPLEADVIIIDEMSMVDIQLFQALLKAVAPGTRLVLVGDVNQLPSVGPGQVLRDLIASRCFPMVELKKIFRQAEESDIIVNAHRINRGEQIALDNKSKDFFLLERNDINVIYKHMIQLIQEKMPRYVKATPFDIQVLTPMRKGPLGCETLNGILQRYLNPSDGRKKEHMSGAGIYREGDKVMQIRNNYQLEWEIVSKYGIPVDRGTGVFNGDMGRIVEIQENASCLVVEYDEQRRVTYPFSLLEELELSYAITIHKSQGSEYPAVVMPLLSGPRMLFNRNLLYTAITRAKSCVTILGSSATVRGMIDNVSENRRYTALAARIREQYENAPG
ncbi:SF1B family DNA helicase RecD2 [Acetatifactor aquisgranensis]|uniref:SF1B family DNA helicase RecD2 n=1 Tax=Acetatifactor aquisgranensis TaxID=2941233 RepID=UPI00203B5A39|nr:ATP-dependent RecD-like DNA helicase [Acetatifactor aquisgranensis]MCI8544240.1 ATP-dependent RecD-like DNA helicase [Lachnospiraceae bacterium]